MMIKRTFGGWMIAVALLAAPAGAQLLGSPGEAFLTALKEGNGTKAYGLADSNPTVFNYRGQDGSAALHVVVRTRNSNWLAYLLTNGADPDVGDKSGDTPLILAIRSGYNEGAATLLRSHAQIDKANRLGETPLIAAVQQRNAPLVRTLLKLGANPDKADHAAGYSARDYAKRDSRSHEMLQLIETTRPATAPVAAPAR